MRRMRKPAGGGKSLPELARWQFSAAPPHTNSLKMRPPRFGLRAAISAAWPLSHYRLRFSRKMSGCQRAAPRPDSPPTRRRPPRLRLPVTAYSRSCWRDWSPPTARRPAKSPAKFLDAAPRHRPRHWMPRRVPTRRPASRHCGTGSWRRCTVSRRLWWRMLPPHRPPSGRLLAGPPPVVRVPRRPPGRLPSPRREPASPSRIQHR